MGKFHAKNVTEAHAQWADQETRAILDEIFDRWSFTNAELGWEFTTRDREIAVWALLFLPDSDTGRPAVVPGGFDVTIPVDEEHDHRSLYDFLAGEVHDLFDAMARHEVLEGFKVRNADGTSSPVFTPHAPGLSFRERTGPARRPDPAPAI